MIKNACFCCLHTELSQFLSKCDTVLMDGTFKACEPYEQRHDIFGVQLGEKLPLPFAFLEGKVQLIADAIYWGCKFHLSKRFAAESQNSGLQIPYQRDENSKILSETICLRNCYR